MYNLYTIRFLPNFANVIKVRAYEKDNIIVYSCLDVLH